MADGLARRLRPHVLGLSLGLSAVALALVFASALGAVPSALLPQAPAPVLDAVPHVNAALSALALLTIPGGVVAIRRGRVAHHRLLMLASAALFAAFLALYLYKVSVAGPAPFPGPEGVYRTVYLPVLGVHVLLAVVTVPLVVYALLLAATHPVDALPETHHPRVGRVAASLWFVSFLLGEAVYAMLYVVY
ncbi:MAG: putative membrane protein [uncultured archaeon A07HB70]|nr:MAG: putative membrane protein [uncultured archaeon A07HB70]